MEKVVYVRLWVVVDEKARKLTWCEIHTNKIKYEMRVGCYGEQNLLLFCTHPYVCKSSVSLV